MLNLAVQGMKFVVGGAVIGATAGAVTLAVLTSIRRGH